MEHTEFISPHPFTTKIIRHVHLKDLAMNEVSVKYEKKTWEIFGEN